MVIPGMFIPFGVIHAPPPAFDISFLERRADSTNQTTYTFSGVSLGKPAKGRLIVVLVSTDGALPSSVTVDGVSASQIETASGTEARMTMYAAEVPLGLSGDIVVNFSSGAGDCHIFALRLVGQKSSAPYGIATPNGGSNTTRSQTLDAPKGGGIIFGVRSGRTSTSITNAETLYDTYHDDGVALSAVARYITLGDTESRTITATDARCVIAASWV